MNMMQKDLAYKAKISEASVSKYLYNKRKPSEKTLIKICKILKVDKSYFLDDKKTYSKIEKQKDLAEIIFLIHKHKNDFSEKEKLSIIKQIVSI